MGLKMLFAFVSVFFLTLTSAIYPDDHWEYSTELTTENFDSFVESEIESGRTLFVRWIASPGWGWWRKQAPAWNKVVKDFASNPDVSFGDVNLKEQQIRGTHKPGAGGWPTIKYFNKDTGVEGHIYDKKTDEAMCDELGPKGEDYMTLYVEEAGKTSLCNIDTGKGCSEKQSKYIDKIKSKTTEENTKQIERLSKMKDSDMTSELRDWKNQRIKLLKEYLKQDEEQDDTQGEPEEKQDL